MSDKVGTELKYVDSLCSIHRPFAHTFVIENLSEIIDELHSTSKK